MKNGPHTGLPLLMSPSPAILTPPQICRLNHSEKRRVAQLNTPQRKSRRGTCSAQAAARKGHWRSWESWPRTLSPPTGSARRANPPGPPCGCRQRETTFQRGGCSQKNETHLHKGDQDGHGDPHLSTGNRINKGRDRCLLKPSNPRLIPSCRTTPCCCSSISKRDCSAESWSQSKPGTTCSASPAEPNCWECQRL